MATGYIIWDSVKHVLVAGPFPSKADADAFQDRLAQHTAETDSFTNEKVTLA